MRLVHIIVGQRRDCLIRETQVYRQVRLLTPQNLNAEDSNPLQRRSIFYECINLYNYIACRFVCIAVLQLSKCLLTDIKHLLIHTTRVWTQRCVGSDTIPAIYYIIMVDLQMLNFTSYVSCKTIIQMIWINASVPFTPFSAILMQVHLIMVGKCDLPGKLN